MRSRARFLVGVLAATLVACSIITSVDDLTGGSRDAGAIESGRDDAGGAGDGPATGVPEAGAGPWCEQQMPAPTFCADFDENPVGFDWEGVSDTGGTVALDPISVSSPNSARVVQETTENCAFVGFTRSFKGPFTELHLAMMMRTGNAQADAGSFVGGPVVVVGHTASDGGAGCNDIVGLSTTSALLAFQGTTDDTRPLTRYPILGQWTALELDIFAEGNGLRASVRLDGVTVLDSAVAPQCSFAGDVFLKIGDFCTGARQEMRVDNVRLTLK